MWILRKLCMCSWKLSLVILKCEDSVNRICSGSTKWNVSSDVHIMQLYLEHLENQSILKEIGAEYSLEGLMLKLQYFGHLMWRAYSLEKTLMLGGLRAGEEGGNRDGWMRWDGLLYGIIDSMDMSLSKIWEIVEDRKTWGAAIHGVTRVRETEQWENRK